ncbi:hypothetical protein BD779DRAFT_1790489 [Infundibulicybe gibba]|nr:hypothetical protein BD779DRAFT_1790489 [Infundibulicybe gibba]
MTLNTSEAFTLDSSPTAKMTLNAAEALVLGNIIQGIFYGTGRRKHRLSLNAAPKGSVVAFVVVDYLAQMMLAMGGCCVPGFLAFVSLGEGITSFIFGCMLLPSTNLETDSHLLRLAGILAYSTSLIVNALTTSLIVTKILLTSREVHPSSGSSSRPLRTIVAMLIESGLLMLIFQLIFVILFSTQYIGFDIISGATTQIYGITPTLLNIRVVMGSVRDKTTEKTHSLRFAHSGGATTQGTGPHMSAAGVQFQDIDTEPDDGCKNEKRPTTPFDLNQVMVAGARLVSPPSHCFIHPPDAWSSCRLRTSPTAGETLIL